MKFEDYLMQQGDEKQKKLDLEEEVRTIYVLVIVPSGFSFYSIYRRENGIIPFEVACGDL